MKLQLAVLLKAELLLYCILSKQLYYSLHIFLFTYDQALENAPSDGSSKWQPIEAALFCMQSIAQFIPSSEAEIMPRVCCLCSPHHHILLYSFAWHIYFTCLAIPFFFIRSFLCSQSFLINHDCYIQVNFVLYSSLIKFHFYIWTALNIYQEPIDEKGPGKAWTQFLSKYCLVVMQKLMLIN